MRTWIRDQVMAIEPAGEADVAVMSTSTKTFIAEGYASHNCDRWWIVAADAKIVRHEELPATWGLLLPDARGVLKAEVAAPKMKALPVDRKFLCGLLRAATKLGNRATAQALRTEYERGRLAEVEQHERVTKRLTDAHVDLERRVREFEAAAGISIATRWGSDATKTGQVVRDVLAGKYDRDRDDLGNIRRIAAGIVERIDVELPQAQGDDDAQT